jgi:putative hydrolase of the HAD superfamily
MRDQAIFIDIGGVLLTNGWDRTGRGQAIEMFHLDKEEIDNRHALTFDAYETGKLTLDEYLKFVIFYQPRAFTPAVFKEFMFAQSKPLSPMLEYMKTFKQNFNMPVVAVSNEGRELADYRIKTFDLKEIIDIFVVSGYVQLRKPDKEIYRLALDLAQVKPQNVVYIEDRQLLVDVGSSLGLKGIRHQDRDKTAELLKEALKRK